MATINSGSTLPITASYSHESAMKVHLSSLVPKQLPAIVRQWFRDSAGLEVVVLRNYSYIESIDVENHDLETKRSRDDFVEL